MHWAYVLYAVAGAVEPHRKRCSHSPSHLRLRRLKLAGEMIRNCAFWDFFRHCDSVQRAASRHLCAHAVADWRPCSPLRLLDDAMHAHLLLLVMPTAPRRGRVSTCGAHPAHPAH